VRRAGSYATADIVVAVREIDYKYPDSTPLITGN